jgi:4-hydroxy 2-oxovalerate aldolase
MVMNSDVKVVDCTVRDGGLINRWQFDDDLVRAVFQAIDASGVDYLELGYRASEKMFSPTEYGPWRFTRDDHVRKIIGSSTPRAKLGAMVDIGRVEPQDILPADESPLSFFRVATYLKEVTKAVELANLIADRGYETFINIMAISTVNDYELAAGLRLIDRETKVTAVTVVDSYGSLLPNEVDHLVNLFRKELPERRTGFHAHNNLQLGFANTIQAIQSGATFCDATVYGIGRAAGNCPMELLIGFLKDPRFNLEPVLQVIQDKFVDLREKIEWGYLLPYMITGMLNEHPRVGIAWRNSPERDRYADFYRQLTTPECTANN